MCWNRLDKWLHIGNTLLMLIVILYPDSVTLHAPILKQCLKKYGLVAEI